jgi:hypothetical protein
MLLSRHQNAGQNHEIKIGKNVAQLFGDDNKSKLDSGGN